MAFLVTSSEAFVELSIEISFFFLIVVRTFIMRSILSTLLSVHYGTVNGRYDVVQQTSGLIRLM